jgi:hypothetical protein
MKQNSTAGSPAFSRDQKLFGKWRMKYAATISPLAINAA